MMKLGTVLRLSLVGIALLVGCSQNTAEPKTPKGEPGVVTDMNIQSETEADE